MHGFGNPLDAEVVVVVEWKIHSLLGEPSALLGSTVCAVAEVDAVES